MIVELYDALRQAGVDDPTAQAAAKAVIGSDLVTKADLKAEMAEIRQGMSEMKTELIKWNVGAILAVTTIFTAVVKLL